MNKKNNSKKHWLVVAILCGLIASFSIPINLGGVFLSPVAIDLGFQRGDFSLHTTLTLFISAIVALYVPRLMEKYHFKYLLLAAALLTSVPNIMMGFSHHLWQFNLWGSIRGVGAGLISMVPIAIVINHWFHKHHGLVTSIIVSFTGLSGALLTPIFAGLIGQVGWRYSYFISGALIILLLLPGIIIPFAVEPQSEGLLPFGAGEVIQTNKFKEKVQVSEKNFNKHLLLSIMVVAVAHTSVGGIVQHFPSFSEANGYSAGIGAMMLSGTMIGSILFKMMIGAISDRLNATVANLVMLVINSFAVGIVLTTPSPSFLILGAFLYGSAFAIPAVGITLLAKEQLGNHYFNKFFPLISFGVSTSGAASISLIGYLFDFAGSYSPALLLTLVVNVFNISLLTLMTRKAKKEISEAI
ncbi:MFS transporter [Jeotgalibaca sp. A127]|uniref:MFS transporter n=1 Tax=Jeotgalibaca sp. A127 TaxID=3457324 RepID=UPI003FD6BB3F